MKSQCEVLRTKPGTEQTPSFLCSRKKKKPTWHSLHQCFWRLHTALLAFTRKPSLYLEQAFWLCHHCQPLRAFNPGGHTVCSETRGFATLGPPAESRSPLEGTAQWSHVLSAEFPRHGKIAEQPDSRALHLLFIYFLVIPLLKHAKDTALERASHLHASTDLPQPRHIASELTVFQTPQAQDTESQAGGKTPSLPLIMLFKHSMLFHIYHFL